MVMPSASFSAAGPLLLPFVGMATTVVFGMAVMDVVPPILTGVTVVIHLVSHSGAIPVSVAVAAAGLARHRGRMQRVVCSLGLLWHARLMVMVLVASQERSVTGFNNQRSIEVGFHVRSDVEGRGQTEALLGIQLGVEGLAAGLVLPPQLIGPLLPH